MLARVSGSTGGIEEYLEEGRKQDSHHSRHELDQRVPLLGDFELLKDTLDLVQTSGDKYLHITLSFKESELEIPKAAQIVDEYVKLLTAAYAPDEIGAYAEMHLPKIKYLVHNKTGELLERKPHIHLVIPKVNLQTGKYLDLVRLYEHQERYLEAIQEHINVRFDLASPRQNKRLETNPNAAILSRAKGDEFLSSNSKFKADVLSKVLNIPEISNLEQLSQHIRQTYGESIQIKTRNQGVADKEYLNIKFPDAPKGINLKEHFFKSSFLALTVAERRNLNPELNTSQTVLDRQNLDKWVTQKSFELRYIQTAGDKLKQTYKSLPPKEQIALLQDLHHQQLNRTKASYDSAKHRPERQSNLISNGSTFSRNRAATPHHTSGQSLFSFDRFSAIGQSRFDQMRLHQLPSSSLGNHPHWRRIIEASEQKYVHNALMSLQNNAPAIVYRTRNSGSRMLDVRANAGKPRHVIPVLTSDHLPSSKPSPYPCTVAGVLLRNHASHKAARSDTTFKTVLFASVLPHLERFQINQDNYPVSTNEKGEERIRCGQRQLSLNDFLTRELHLSWPEAKAILEQGLHDQENPLHENTHPLHNSYPRSKASAQNKTPFQALAYEFRQSPEFVAIDEKWKTQKIDERSRLRTLSQTYHGQRRDLKESLSAYSPKDRLLLERSQRSLLATQFQKDREALLLTIAEERSQLKLDRQDLNSGFPDFLRQKVQAEKNQTALHLLRQKYSVRSDRVLGKNHLSCHSKPLQETTPPLFKNLDFTVHMGGTVEYFDKRDATHRPLFLDTATHVVFGESYDQPALHVAIVFAAEKFNKSLQVNGTDAFKQAVVETAIKQNIKDLVFSDSAQQAQYLVGLANHASSSQDHDFSRH